MLQAALLLKAEDIAIIRQIRRIPDELSLSTVSDLFRVSKLIEFLGLRFNALQNLVNLFRVPASTTPYNLFADATVALQLLETWQKITNSAFTFPQLNYIVRGKDNLSRPLASTIPQVLRLAKSLFDGLN